MNTKPQCLRSNHSLTLLSYVSVQGGSVLVPVSGRCNCWGRLKLLNLYVFFFLKKIIVITRFFESNMPFLHEIASFMGAVYIYARGREYWILFFFIVDVLPNSWVQTKACLDFIQARASIFGIFFVFSFSNWYRYYKTII